MSVRVFDGINDVVDFLIGAASSTGTWTMVALVKFDAGVSWQSLLSFDITATGSEIALGRHGSSGQIWVPRGGGAGGSADAINVSSTDGWVLVAATKSASGNQVVTMHKGVVGGAWTHTAAESLGNVSAQQSARFGAIDGADFFKGKAAVLAKWNVGLTNLQLESLLTSFTRDDWLALSPSALWDAYDSFATDHTGGGATGTITGTTADAVDVPTGWADWEGGGGSSPQTVNPSALSSAASFGTPTAAPGGVSESVNGLASASSFGTPSATPGGVSAAPGGLGSASTFGTPTIVPGGTTVEVSGLDSASTFGSVSVDGSQNVPVSGLSSASSFGNPTIATGGTTVEVTGLNSASQFGVPVPEGGVPATFHPAIHGGKHR